ncbi:membrane-spanning 4-domains subfamily A member 4A-like [Pseudophryne corroboree]|uniref:membrane-spanning 4-domains subfamily A member 4A-like n=1 Tax=Pseudophryne corroboree TaxID=495146 RepID=UPI00308212BC
MHADGESPPPFYEAIPATGSSAVHNMNTPVPNSFQNVMVPPPPYSVSAETKAWNFPPPTVPQWGFVTNMPQCTDSSSPFYRTFLASRPKALGTVLIVSGILQIALGIGLIYTIDIIYNSSGISFWGSVFYIIAGALTVAAQRKPSIGLVKGSLSLNIISTIMSFIAFVLNCIDLAIIYCPIGYYHDHGYHRRCQQQLTAGYVVLSFLLVVNLLVIFVSLSVSIFGCRSVSQVPPNVPQVFLIQNDVMVSMNPFTTFPAIPPPAPPPPRYTAEEVIPNPMR